MSTAKNRYFISKRSFDYAGTQIEPGDPWVPEGYKNDEKIIEHLMSEPSKRAFMLGGNVHPGIFGTSTLVEENTRDELREMCKEHGLSVGGTKEDLAERLVKQGAEE